MAPEPGPGPLQTGPSTLPTDSHVHSQWSWDAWPDRWKTCERAAEIGLPSLAFTEHVDFTPWSLGPGEKVRRRMAPLVSDNMLIPPALDLNGYWTAWTAAGSGSRACRSPRASS